VQSGRRQTGVLAEGDCFGEASYVRGARRTATIKAAVPVTLVRVSLTLLESDLNTAGARRILDCVGHEIRKHLPEFVSVRGNNGENRWCNELERKLLWRVRARGLDDPACDVADVDLLARENQPPLNLAAQDVATRCRQVDWSNDGEEVVANRRKTMSYARGFRRAVNSGDGVRNSGRQWR
jgi:hypothetical protein